MLQGFTESLSYFSQTLKADLDDVEFPEGSVLLRYVDDLLFCSPSQASSPEDSINLLTFLALKGHKVSEEKLTFVQTQVCYLGHLISEQGLHLRSIRYIESPGEPESRPCPFSYIGTSGDTLKC